MKICLFIDRTALLVNDHLDHVTIEPPCRGVLEVEGETFTIENGSPVPALPELIGHVRVLFTTEGGPRYVGIRTYMDKGIPASHIDYAAAYVPLRMKLDELERQVDQLAKAYHALAAETRHDALGFLTHNTKKQEV